MPILIRGFATKATSAPSIRKGNQFDYARPVVFAGNSVAEGKPKKHNNPVTRRKRL